jgi:hypothetical protein
MPVEIIGEAGTAGASRAMSPRDLAPMRSGTTLLDTGLVSRTNVGLHSVRQIPFEF